VLELVGRGSRLSQEGPQRDRLFEANPRLLGLKTRRAVLSVGPGLGALFGLTRSSVDDGILFLREAFSAFGSLAPPFWG
jgi:hypothetical protein